MFDLTSQGTKNFAEANEEDAFSFRSETKQLMQASMYLFSRTTSVELPTAFRGANRRWLIPGMRSREKPR